MAMKHLVIKLGLMLFLINVCCAPSQKVKLSQDFFCEYLDESKIDTRLNHIPTPEEYKKGATFYRLKERPDSIAPLKVYLWNKTIKPILYGESKKEINTLGFNFDEGLAAPVLTAFLQSNCNDFNIYNQNNIDNTIFKYDNPDRGIFIQVSDLYFNNEQSKAILFIRVTRGKLASTETAIILEKREDEWIIVDQIGISIS